MFKAVNESPRISDLFKRKSWRESQEVEEEGFERHSMGEKVSSVASYRKGGLEVEARDNSQKIDLL